MVTNESIFSQFFEFGVNSAKLINNDIIIVIEISVNDFMYRATHSKVHSLTLRLQTSVQFHAIHTRVTVTLSCF